MKKKTTPVAAGLTSFMDERDIQGFIVKEWTTQQFCQLYPFLKMIVDKLLAKGMSLESFDAGQLTAYLPTISDAVIPVMTDIILLSCPEKSDEDLKQLPWPKSIQLVMAILKVNMEHLADFFGQSPS